jgi:hypothetical protein
MENEEFDCKQFTDAIEMAVTESQLLEKFFKLLTIMYRCG